MSSISVIHKPSSIFRALILFLFFLIGVEVWKHLPTRSFHIPSTEHAKGVQETIWYHYSDNDLCH